ncbi:TspO/MBR family protein [Arthrobacter halodurans]|uniref:TspO/MBR family protein n=1 Tax=Arthrobacter halodurans TaxID=516699 RepID=A0ABV4UK02_9MICC
MAATPSTASLTTPNRVPPAPRWRWWHAAAVGVAANAIGSLPAGYRGDTSYFDRLNTPPGSPPGWLFAPVWAFNNAATLWSNLRVANLAPDTPDRRKALAYEGISWALFASFSGLYFGLRSPVLGAAVTVASLGATSASVAATSRIDPKAAWGLAPRLAWLGYASYVAVASALTNRDEFFQWAPRHR